MKNIVNFKCILKDRPEDDFIINSSELKKVFGEEIE
jgi:hypothetical protein